MDEQGFAPWELDWTPTHVERFWSWLSATNKDQYFAGAYGGAVLDEVGKLMPPKGAVVVDYGAGVGGLTARLLERGMSVYAMEGSPESVELLQQRFGGQPGFRGALGIDQPLPHGAAQAVFLLEVIEHMHSAELATALVHVKGVLAPGGMIVITTPNDELLRKGQAMCPNCGCVFHRMQHVASFSAASLARRMEADGFQPVLTRQVNFARSRLGRRVNILRSRMNAAYRAPNLLYVGRMR
jgi:2-polyprenyl-3-methyl-5-hydroxy-6-metoxy-1,4-benzoquinol methylase